MAKKIVWHPTQDAKLRTLVAGSTSFNMVAAKLTGNPDSYYKQVKKRIQELGLDTRHFTGRPGRSVRWSEQQLREAVAGSRSIRQTIQKLGLVPAGGNYDQVQHRIKALDLDTSHFTGKGWNKGGLFRPVKERRLEDVLVVGQWTGSHKLKKRLFRAGLKSPCCELCGWADQAPDGRIPVELDHINGDRCDNRLENLRILCPNCHSLQPTHRGLNKQHLRRRTD